MRVIEQLGNPFYAPLESVLIKGVEEGDKWIVYLEASNEVQDQEGEVVDMNALQKAADYFLSKGVISWDHKHKQTGDPGFIIGEPLEVKFTEDHRTLVKGWLYKYNDIAKKVWNNIRSGAKKLGSSVGGGILHKAAARIKSVIWDEIAITHKPVNDTTLGNVAMIPFAAFAKALQYAEGTGSIESFVKALMAGSGVNAAEFTGGRALTPESLQGSTVNMVAPVKSYDVVSREELDKLFSSMIKSVMAGGIQDYNDLVYYVLNKGYSGPLARRIINHVAQNLSLR